MEEKMTYSGYYDTELDEVSMKIATIRIGENEVSKRKGLEMLKENLLSIDNLQSRLDDEFLLRFLRVAKFDATKAFDRLCRFYQARKKYPHIFKAFYPSATPTAQVARHLWASPNRTVDHSVVIMFKRGLFNPSTMIFDEMFLLDLIVMDYLVGNCVTQLCGATVIIDFNGYGFQNFLQDTPWRLRIALDAFQNTFPLRFREIHIINTPAIFSILLNMAHPLLTKKIRNRLHIHGNNDSLLSSLPADILPEEYGGKIPKSDLIDLVQEVIQKEGYYRDQLQYGYRDRT